MTNLERSAAIGAVWGIRRGIAKRMGITAVLSTCVENVRHALEGEALMTIPPTTATIALPIALPEARRTGGIRTGWRF